MGVTFVDTTSTPSVPSTSHHTPTPTATPTSQCKSVNRKRKSEESSIEKALAEMVAMTPRSRKELQRKIQETNADDIFYQMCALRAKALSPLT